MPPHPAPVPAATRSAPTPAPAQTASPYPRYRSCTETRHAHSASPPAGENAPAPPTMPLPPLSLLPATNNTATPSGASRSPPWSSRANPKPARLPIHRAHRLQRRLALHHNHCLLPRSSGLNHPAIACAKFLRMHAYSSRWPLIAAPPMLPGCAVQPPPAAVASNRTTFSSVSDICANR